MVPDTFEGPETKDYAPPDWRPQRQTRVQLDPSDLMTVPRTLGCRENSAPRPWAEPRGESKDFDFDNALHYFGTLYSTSVFVCSKYSVPWEVYYWHAGSCRSRPLRDRAEMHPLVFLTRPKKCMTTCHPSSQAIERLGTNDPNIICRLVGLDQLFALMFQRCSTSRRIGLPSVPPNA